MGRVIGARFIGPMLAIGCLRLHERAPLLKRIAPATGALNLVTHHVRQRRLSDRALERRSSFSLAPSATPESGLEHWRKRRRY